MDEKRFLKSMARQDAEEQDELYKSEAAERESKRKRAIVMK